jgi:UDP:flavonoid glycosyltransferase YjiC (YdhE family)
LNSRPLRLFLGAFGDPGHAFPMLALGQRLVARGHEVAFETWARWARPVREAGMEFIPAPEYPVFPTRERPLKPYEAVTLATPLTRRAIASRRPDAVVHDILTLAPALAAELEQIPVATLVPHLYPVTTPGHPPYALGARLPRTQAGARLWSRVDPLMQIALRQGRSELNETRRRLGLPALERLHGGISERLCIVATFPQLEYPRHWPAHVHVVGPVLWEPGGADVALPAGTEPLVLVAPSTAQDPGHRLLRAALTGLAERPVRLLGAAGGRPLSRPARCGHRDAIVNWLTYSRAMPDAALVITHAGHGTLARALACGTPVLAVPHSGDMGENAARADWAGVGVRLPWRLLSPATLWLAVRRALSDGRYAARAAELARWAGSHDGAARAAELVEQLASGL